MERETTKLAKLTLLLSSCILTAALGGIAVHYQQIYFEHYPYFFDPVVYAWQNINLFVKLAHTHRLELALNEWLTNPRYPLRTVPLILFSPQLLSNNVGYIATALPALLVFLFVLGLTLYQRTRSLAYAIASMILFCSIPGLLNLRYGIGEYWLDLPAALWVGSSALCLINFIDVKKSKWLVLSSTLAACACLSRYIAIAYIIVVCCPILSLYLVQQWYRQKSFQRAVMLPLAASFIPLMALSGYFIIAQYFQNYEYYTKFGYALKNEALGAFLFITGFLFNSFFGAFFASILFVIFCINLFLVHDQISRQYKELLVTGWCAVSVIIFLTILGTNEAFHSTMYAAPLLFFVAVSPVSTHNLVRTKVYQRFRQLFASVLVILALLFCQDTLKQNFYLATHPDPYSQEQKQLDRSIAKILAQVKLSREDSAWDAYFDEHSFTPSVEAFYDSRQAIKPRNVFSIHETYWKARYPGLAPDELSLRIYKENEELVDIAVIFEDPKRVSKTVLLKNPYSQAVATRMAVYLPKDPKWKRLSVIETQTYGRLIAYQNLSRLKSSALTLPR